MILPPAILIRNMMYLLTRFQKKMLRQHTVQFTGILNQMFLPGLLATKMNLKLSQLLRLIAIRGLLAFVI
jgi:hypothetical protein